MEEKAEGTVSIQTSYETISVPVRYETISGFF